MIERLLEIKKIRAERADKAVKRQEYRVSNAAAQVQRPNVLSRTITFGARKKKSDVLLKQNNKHSFSKS